MPARGEVSANTGEAVHAKGAAVPDTGRAGGAGGRPESAGVTGLLNLNTASAADLEALPGIGPALAARILDYRASHGPFREVRDLLQVSGVGEKTLARFADRLRAP